MKKVILASACALALMATGAAAQTGPGSQNGMQTGSDTMSKDNGMQKNKMKGTTGSNMGTSGSNMGSGNMGSGNMGSGSGMNTTGGTGKSGGEGGSGR